MTSKAELTKTLSAAERFHSDFLKVDHRFDVSELQVGREISKLRSSQTKPVNDSSSQPNTNSHAGEKERFNNASKNHLTKSIKSLYLKTPVTDKVTDKNNGKYDGMIPVHSESPRLYIRDNRVPYSKLTGHSNLFPDTALGRAYKAETNPVPTYSRFKKTIDSSSLFTCPPWKSTTH